MQGIDYWYTCMLLYWHTSNRMGVIMVKGENMAVYHICKDGQRRRLTPVYFRDVDPQTGKRHFVRSAWFCGHCGYGDFTPDKGGTDGKTAQG